MLYTLLHSKGIRGKLWHRLRLSLIDCEMGCTAFRVDCTCVRFADDPHLMAVHAACCRECCLGTGNIVGIHGIYSVSI